MQAGSFESPSPVAPRQPSAAESKNPRAALFVTVALDVGLPLGVYYGLRLLGADQWLALVLSSVIALGRLVYQVLRTRKVGQLPLFSLAMVLIGTLISLVTGDPRLLLARESYITALLGLWILGTLFAARPFIFTVTLRLLAADAADRWRADWRRSAGFRRVMRLLTAGWGGAFVLDASARVVMAYTLPVDIVPVLSTALLVALLVLLVRLSKAQGRRLPTRD